MEIIIGIIAAIIFSILSGRKKGGFPKLPDGRNDTPLGPGGHRNWPAQPPVVNRPMEGQGQSQVQGQPLPELSEEGFGSEGQVGSEGQGELEGRTEYGDKDPVSPTLREPHESAERIFAGQSSSERIGSQSLGNTSTLFQSKQDLVKGIVLTEVLGPPRARNPRQNRGLWKYKR